MFLCHQPHSATNKHSIMRAIVASGVNLVGKRGSNVKQTSHRGGREAVSRLEVEAWGLSLDWRWTPEGRLPGGLEVRPEVRLPGGLEVRPEGRLPGGLVVEAWGPSARWTGCLCPLRGILGKLLASIVLFYIIMKLCTQYYHIILYLSNTDLCAFSLKHGIAFYHALSSLVYVCFLDVSKAFDRLIHWICFHKLISCGVPIIIGWLFLFGDSCQQFCVRSGNFYTFLKYE